MPAIIPCVSKFYPTLLKFMTDLLALHAEEGRNEDLNEESM